MNDIEKAFKDTIRKNPEALMLMEEVNKLRADKKKLCDALHKDTCCSIVHCKVGNFSVCPSYFQCLDEEIFTNKCTCGAKKRIKYLLKDNK